MDKNKLYKKKLDKKKFDKKKLEVILCGGSRRQLGGRPTRDLCRPHTLVIIVIIVIIAIIIIIIAISIIIVIIIIIIINTISARLEMKVIGFVVGPSVQNLEFVDLVMARVSCGISVVEELEDVTTVSWYLALAWPVVVNLVW